MCNDKIVISGYELDGTMTQRCDHCNKRLKHAIKLSDGRQVGAQCLNIKLTKARVYDGKKYRHGQSFIIKAAKVVQFVTDESKWVSYGVSREAIVYDAL